MPQWVDLLDSANQKYDNGVSGLSANNAKDAIDEVAGTLGETNTGQNVGAGQGSVFRDKTGVNLNFKRLVEGANISITDGADTVTIASAAGTGEANLGANVGTGDAEVFANKTGVTLNFKRLVEGANITLTDGADTVTIASTGGGTGDVVGPASSNNEHLALFDGTTGKLIKEASYSVDAVCSFDVANQFSTQILQKTDPAAADVFLIEDSAAAGQKKRVLWSNVKKGDYVNAQFTDHAIFNVLHDPGVGSAVDFATSNKATIDASGKSVTVDAPGIGNFMLVLTNSASLISIAPLAGGSILWDSGTPPTWGGTSVLALFYDGTSWYGSAMVSVA